MPSGTRKIPKEFSCKKCKISFFSQHPRPIYCEKHRDWKTWQVWSLEYKKRLTRLCSMAKNRARSKNVPFDITPDYLIKLWEKNEGCCSLTGREFDLAAWGEKGQVNPNTPSVDRIVPALGYTKGNIRLITYHMNVALSDFGVEEFEKLVKAYTRVT